VAAAKPVAKKKKVAKATARPTVGKRFLFTGKLASMSRADATCQRL